MLLLISVNQMVLSGPAVIPQGVPLDVGTGNSVIVPLVVMRPILPFWLVKSLLLSVDSVNQRFPSGPVVMLFTML